MRLKEIRTRKLFGLFDHIIPLNLDHQITIIHGPNGYGKTTILRLVADVLRARFHLLRTLPIDALELEFDDGNILIARKCAGDSTANGDNESLMLEFTNEQPYHPPRVKWPEDVSRRLIERIVPGLERVGPDMWASSEREFLNRDEVWDRFGDLIQKHSASQSETRDFPKWFERLQESIEVHFIRANRLERVEGRFEHFYSSVDRGVSLMPVVEAYAAELAGEIQRTLAEYAETSQSLDRSFPNRLVNSSRPSNQSMEDLQESLEILEERRRKLTDAGLLDHDQEAFKISRNIEDSKKDVLRVFVEDARNKLSVFDELYRKIDLFKTLLNERLLLKSVSIDKRDGIVFKTANNARLEPSGLSSGEQHEVVLLFELLFKVKNPALILIDEPELSLHVVWQKQFLKDLAQIVKISKFDALIATHSPQIINDRWDLTVELKGPNECGNTLTDTHSLTKHE